MSDRLSQENFRVEVSSIPGLGVIENTLSQLGAQSPVKWNLRQLELLSPGELADEESVRRGVCDVAAKRLLEQHGDDGENMVVAVDWERVEDPGIDAVKVRPLIVAYYSGENQTSHEYKSYHVAGKEASLLFLSRWFEVAWQQLPSGIWFVEGDPKEVHEQDSVLDDFYMEVERELIGVRRRYLHSVIFDGMDSVTLDEWRMFCKKDPGFRFGKALWGVDVGEVYAHIILFSPLSVPNKAVNGGWWPVHNVLPCAKSDWYLYCVVYLEHDIKYDGPAVHDALAKLDPKWDWVLHRMVALGHDEVRLPVTRRRERRVKQRLVRECFEWAEESNK